MNANKILNRNTTCQERRTVADYKIPKRDKKRDKNIKRQLEDTSQENNNLDTSVGASTTIMNRLRCKFYDGQRGCRNGSSCMFSHSPPQRPWELKDSSQENNKLNTSAGTCTEITERNANEMQCKYFDGQRGCRNGSSFIYSHSPPQGPWDIPPGLVSHTHPPPRLYPPEPGFAHYPQFDGQFLQGPFSQVFIPMHYENQHATIPSIPAAAAIHREPTNLPLIILDVNHLLCERVDKRVADRAQTPDAIIGNAYIYVRPNLDNFLNFLFERFTVAVWTSARLHNAAPLVDFLFGHLKSWLAFVWTQSECTAEKVVGQHKPVFHKELASVWNMFGAFNPSNTVLLDDSPEKCTRNPPHTAIHPAPFVFKRKAQPEPNATDEVPNNKKVKDPLCINTKKQVVNIRADIQNDEANNDIHPGGKLWSYLEELSKFHGDLRMFIQSRPYTCQQI